ncbi:MarR family transcriptional regulator [Nocardioides sp. NPDC127503]|uniref:MarR family winged helix-turn-helix transcriptional regulator n=1 Tax=Nocardioides sp. NPDC127503 TaxID=3154516 RepID=UPI003330FA6B
MPPRTSDAASPIDDPLLTTFGRLIEASSRSERWMGRQLQAQCGLPHTWFEVLLRLARSDGGQLTMGDLATQTALTTGGITKLIDRMDAAGYVTRVPSPRDRRVTLAEVTKAGRVKLDEAVLHQQSNVNHLFRDFTQAEVALLDTLLDRLRMRPADVALDDAS